MSVTFTLAPTAVTQSRGSMLVSWENLDEQD